MKVVAGIQRVPAASSTPPTPLVSGSQSPVDKFGLCARQVAIDPKPASGHRKRWSTPVGGGSAKALRLKSRKVAVKNIPPPERQRPPRSCVQSSIHSHKANR